MVIAHWLRSIEAVEIYHLSAGCRIHESRSMAFLRVEYQLEAIHYDVLFKLGDNFLGWNGTEKLLRRGFPANRSASLSKCGHDRLSHAVLARQSNRRVVALQEICGSLAYPEPFTGLPKSRYGLL